MKKLSIQDFQNRLDIIHPGQHLIALTWGGDRVDTKVQCGLCGDVFIKKGGYFLDKRKISICKKCFPTQSNTLKTDWAPPQDYILLSKYEDMHHKVTIKHIKCGFIWNITPANLKLGKGCPKCNKKVSKGEQAIKCWLDNHFIPYIFQYPLDYNGHHYKIDFYLPSLDKYIEYNGEQHYISVDFFGGEQRLQIQQQRDKEIEELLKEKLIVISYKDFENIDTILESSTTIP